MEKPQVAMVGLAVMGSNLIRNIESRGYSCAVYNRSGDVTEKFMADNRGKNFVAAGSLKELVSCMKAPRMILIMVKAGAAVDAVIDGLLPLVDKGDIIADLGNSYFQETRVREKRCREKGVNFLGVGVSGGEEGALKGPSIMTGGAPDAAKLVTPIFNAIAAKAPDSCHAYIGPDGAGHFVKMVHNGIEYGDMQLIAEGYHLLRDVIGCKPDELAQIFSKWNEGVLSSFLIEITSKIFREKDSEGSGFLVDKILDKASQKGTGKWTAQLALDLGAPIPTLASAVDARSLSSLKDERIAAAAKLTAPSVELWKGDRAQFIQAVHDALFCSKIVSYAQGMRMLQAASKEFNWNLNLSSIASIWRGGCIIRAQFLNQMMRAYKESPELANLLLDPYMLKEVSGRVANWRMIVSLAAQRGVPVLAFGSALSYYDSYRLKDLPQNLTQAQRDFFGAHTFERSDKAGSFHHNWGV